MNKFKLRIVTPDKNYFDQEVEGITLNTSEGGETTIYAHHADFIANIDISPLSIRNNGHKNHYAIGGGVIQIRSQENLVVLIVNSIESIDEIDLERAKESKIQAEKMIGEVKTPRESIELERQIKRALNRIKIKNEYKDI